jgi:hypothetical protein
VANETGASEARRFLSEHISSAEQLEVLLLLHSEPGRDFNAAEVSGRVFTVPASALLRLEELTAAGLLTSDGAANPRYRYAPGKPELARGVDALAAAYRADRVGIIRHIYEMPRDPVRSLANAFRLRREGD